MITRMLCLTALLLVLVACAESDPAPAAPVAKAPAAAPADPPVDWIEKGRFRYEQLKMSLMRVDPPAIRATNWQNAQPMTLADLRGKVVLIDFWATWCGPCLAGIPKLNHLQDTYGDQGLVVIGVCSSNRGVEKMESIAKARGVRYPICADIESTTSKAYMLDSYPDYFLIGRNGRVRVPDCKSQHLEDAVKMLLAE